jgi:hypothetical protein
MMIFWSYSMTFWVLQILFCLRAAMPHIVHSMATRVASTLYCCRCEVRLAAQEKAAAAAEAAAAVAAAKVEAAADAVAVKEQQLAEWRQLAQASKETASQQLQLSQVGTC